MKIFLLALFLIMVCTSVLFLAVYLFSAFHESDHLKRAYEIQIGCAGATAIALVASLVTKFSRFSK